jgi:transcriptional regulator with XRE-family HTH domain
VSDRPQPGEGDQPEGELARRVDHLFRSRLNPDTGAQYSYEQVADAINEGHDTPVVSRSYLWQLRTGKRDNPTMRHISAIAGFFGVPEQYFFGDGDVDDGQSAAARAAVAAALEDDQVRRVTMSAVGLSKDAVDGIQQMLDAARRIQGLPDQTP